MSKETLNGKECKTCYGFGLWSMGQPSPMGPMDASEGFPTIQCPECKSNPNPINEIQKEKTTSKK